MGTFQYRAFSGGYSPDGDPSDKTDESLRDCCNVDFNTEFGIAVTRPGYVLHSLNATLQATYTMPEVAGKAPSKWIQFDSGVYPVQRNTLVVFRSTQPAQSPTGSGVWYDWTIVANAPNGGDGFAFVLLEQVRAPFCNPVAVDGVVRIGLGPTLEPRILMNLCEEGNPRVTATGTILPTTSSTGLVGSFLGKGGYIIKGWLYDYKNLYFWNETVDGGYTARNMVNKGVFQINPYYQSTAGQKLGIAEVAQEIEVALVPVLDVFVDTNGDMYGTPQYGVAIKYRHLYSALDRVWRIEFNLGAATTISPRVGAVAVYVLMRKKTSSYSDDVDFSRIKTLLVKDILPTSTGIPPVTQNASFTIDANTINVVEGTWSSDTDGRPMTYEDEDHVIMGGVITNVGTWSEKWERIGIRATGFMARKEMMFAYGIDGDPGQAKIAFSTRAAVKGQLDVYRKEFRVWRPEARATTALVQFNDRAYQFTSDNIFGIDLGDRPAFDYMTLMTGFGIGTDMPWTIAVTAGGMYFCNRDGVFATDGGQPVNLTEGRWANVWRAFSDNQLYGTGGHYPVAAGFNSRLREYWVAVNTTVTAPGQGDQVIGDTHVYGIEVFVWSEILRIWKKYQFESIRPTMFVTDQQNRFVVCGLRAVKVAGTETWSWEIVPSAVTWGEPYVTAEDEPGFSWWIETHDLPKNRSGEFIPQALDLAREQGGTLTITVDVYRNDLASPHATLRWNSARKGPARLMGVRSRSLRVKLSGRHSVGTALTPTRIQELTLHTADDQPRRK